VIVQDLKSVKERTKKMVDDICISDVLLAGAKEVFETMVFMDIAEVPEPDRKIEDDAMLGSITFKIDFEGNMQGCLTICCSMSCATTIAANMLGMEPTEEISEAEVRDAIGEVTNMVMGSVKTRVQDKVGNLQVSIPTVVSGRDLEYSLGDGASKVSVIVSLEDEYIADISLLCRKVHQLNPR